MKAGDPFETEAMDQRRSDQRRLLREIPNWVFDRATSDRRPLEHEDHATRGYDRQISESVVRGHIDSQLSEAPELQSLVEDLRRQQTTQHVSEVVSRRMFVERHLDQVARDLQDRAQAARVKQLPPDMVGPLFALPPSPRRGARDR